MSKFLLLSLFLFSLGISGAVAAAADKPNLPDSPAVAVYNPMPEAPTNFDRIQIDNSPGSDICLDIHAFIFKTDDDRVPKLIGETTCMPAGGAAAKKVAEHTKPKLIPANGSH
ncbi:MAG: hypothetical protein WAM71_13000 [Candidatus Korobacteraceae bacterium]